MGGKNLAKAMKKTAGDEPAVFSSWIKYFFLIGGLQRLPNQPKHIVVGDLVDLAFGEALLLQALQQPEGLVGRVDLQVAADAVQVAAQRHAFDAADLIQVLHVANHVVDAAGVGVDVR